MTMPAIEELMRRWRRQIPSKHVRRSRRFRVGPRLFAAMGYLTCGLHPRDYVEIDKLLLVVLFDESVARSVRVLRLVGYGASRVSHGVQWGGAKNAKFFKDLALPPVEGGTGLQLNASKSELFRLALRLHGDLHRVRCYAPKTARPAPQLPPLWAGFRRSVAADLYGDGPEFEALRHGFEMPAEAVFRNFEREHHGLVLYPLDWVSNQLAAALAVFAEIEEFPKRQVFQMDKFPGGLMGYGGASAWDFYSSPRRGGYEVGVPFKERTPRPAKSIS